MNDWNGSISEESFDTDGGKGRGEGQRRGGGIQDDTTAQQQQLLCPSVFVAMLGQPECISVVSQRTKGLLNRSLGWNASGGTRCSLPKERIITLFPNVLTKGAAPQDLVNWLKDNPITDFRANSTTCGIDSTNSYRLKQGLLVMRTLKEKTKLQKQNRCCQRYRQPNYWQEHSDFQAATLTMNLPKAPLDRAHSLRK